jgi:hypothetical protein
MAGVLCYVFTRAEDGRDARESVESWLDEYLGREFYDGFEVGSAQRRSEMRDKYIDRRYADVSYLLDRKREEADKAKLTKDRQGEGWAHHTVANILLERLCPEMPWFNKEAWDWSLPDKDGRLHGNPPDNWWAVEVRFDY